MRGVEGEPFVTRLGNPAQFVVFEVGRSRPLVGAVDQVTGTVVAVAAFDGISRCHFVFTCFSLFFGRHFPLVLGDELAVFVVVEAGKGKRIGKGRLKVISDDLDVSLDIYPNCGLTR